MAVQPEPDGGQARPQPRLVSKQPTNPICSEQHSNMDWERTSPNNREIVFFYNAAVAFLKDTTLKFMQKWEVRVLLYNTDMAANLPLYDFLHYCVSYRNGVLVSSYSLSKNMKGGRGEIAIHIIWVITELYEAIILQDTPVWRDKTMDWNLPFFPNCSRTRHSLLKIQSFLTNENTKYPADIRTLIYQPGVTTLHKKDSDEK